MTEQVRQPHIVYGLESRNRKARKIEVLLGLDSSDGPRRLLEVGVGSGGISAYFGSHTSARYDVDAVDVVDNRVVTDGYRFARVSGTQLPFEDGSFDVVISNHVIEHVGLHEAQRHHLLELKRVLALGGVGYLAVPNRWMLVEPHYRLPFLSWLPHSWRSRYLRMSGRGNFYDCEPLQLGELDQLLREVGLVGQHKEVEALRIMQALEPIGGLLGNVLARCPDTWLAWFRPVIPTLICVFSHERPGDVAR